MGDAAMNREQWQQKLIRQMQGGGEATAPRSPDSERLGNAGNAMQRPPAVLGGGDVAATQSRLGLPAAGAST
jgi:hypothetical protein